MAKIFVSKINNATQNYFTDRTNGYVGKPGGPVWYIQAAVQYNYVDRHGKAIANPYNDNRPGVVRIGDVLNSTDSNIQYTQVGPASVNGYTLDPDATTKTGFDADTNVINHLDAKPTITYVYDKDNAASGSVTYKYIDQDDNVIEVDSKGNPITPFTDTGYEGDAYDKNAAVPDIDGYGKPEWVSGDETGLISDGDVTIVYRYHAKAAPFTIYRVDTDDNPLADPEVVTDAYVDDILDLGQKQRTFSGYTFIELYGSAPVISKAMTDFTWQNAHDLIGTQMTIKANAGRNYKFVYGKATTPNPDTDTNTNTPSGTTPSKPSSTTPDKTPTATTKPKPATPDKLPISGGGTSGTGTGTSSGSNSGTTSGNTHTGTTTTTNGNNVQSATTTPAGTLPKSGSIVNRLLPAIGAAILASLVGLFAFAKKRKS
ncbi:LPXTG cell wall anchor domain-containing protein [Periweissella cryptocerci]|uniref:LPXTG cell wall anchor domain-containing protein n=2 Tax=Periweissella cryptocerci TaxID=2506420 RepID=A0A4P6YXB8_9LACO|nr:LPXTG cell wall anchor domain-containing protein [Periweissella cryptocerci]